MTFSQETRARCDASPDGATCPEEVVWTTPVSRTLVKTILRADGWHVTRAPRYICPACWKNGER